MTKLIYDIETDALLDDATRIHCVVMKYHRKPLWGIFVPADAVAQASRWCLNLIRSPLRPQIKVQPLQSLRVYGATLIAHNQIGFDVPVLRKLLDVDLADANQLVDTLVLSRYLNPDQPEHNLEWWGRQVQIEKVKIKDWKGGTLESYLSRCFYDVLINEAVYDKLMGRFNPHMIPSFGLSQFAYEEMQLQERTGVVFDAHTARQLLEKISKEMQEIAAKVEPTFGEAPLPKSKQPTFPKRPYKKDGSLSSTAIKYGAKIGITDPDQLRASIESGPVTLTAPITLDNLIHVKEYLYTTLGWKPTIWRKIDITKNGKLRESKKRKAERAQKYVRDVWSGSYREDIWDELNMPVFLRKPHEDLDPVELKKIEMIIAGKGRDLPRGPQLCQPVSKALCENLEQLEGETAQQIVAWMSRKNRRGVLAGWLAHDRLQRDGRLPAGSSGITNTHRQRHTVVVNVPQADGKALYGSELRSLFIAPTGRVCVGCDAAGLEARIAAHAAYPHDNGQYARDVLEGDVHSKNAAAYSEVIGRKVSRNDGKPIGYAIMYGCGPPKISAMLGVPKEMGQQLINAYWSVNPGVKAFKDRLDSEWCTNNGKYIEGLDGRPIRTRSQHSLLNAWIQSAGAIVMDKSWQIAKRRLVAETSWYERWGYFHDEFQLYAAPDEAETVGTIVAESIRDSGRYFDLNVPLIGEYKIGASWKDVH